MRREGYEFQVSRPEVIFKDDEDGTQLEPFEEVHIETSLDIAGHSSGDVLGIRRGKMIDMHDLKGNMVKMVYIVPTRGLLGFRYQFLTATRGMGIMNSIFHGHHPMAGTK